MMGLVLIGIGGFLGAITRYGTTVWIERKGKPPFLGTLIVNSIGSFLMGMALHLGTETDTVYAFFVLGFLGALTTFSTFAFEVSSFIRQRQWKEVFLYSISTLVLGFLFVYIGWSIL